jgi:HEAT repeat protein/gas vesicle protein
MVDHQSQVDLFLRRGDARTALLYAGQWAGESDLGPRETAIEIAKCAAAIYRDFVTEPVHEFALQAADALPEEIADTVTKALNRLIRMTNEWTERMQKVREERLARELRDLLRQKHMEASLQRIEKLVRAAGSDVDSQIQRAQYIGQVIATCVNHPREGEQLISLAGRAPERLGLNSAMIAEMKKAREDRQRDMMAANLANIENQWVVVLKASQVEIMNQLPDKNKLGEPDENDLRTAGDLFRSVLRVPLSTGDADLFNDATLLLVDFAPRAVSLTARSSGVETRSHGSLGVRAKLAVARTFMDIGKNEAVTRAYRDWARNELDGFYGAQIIELMGEFRTETYEPFFLELWRQREMRPLHPVLATALGNLASPDAASLLLEELKEKLSAKVIEPQTVAEARRIMEALGRILRSQRTSEDLRQIIVTRTVEAVPESNSALVLAAVTEIVGAKPESLHPKHREWAIRGLVAGLFLQDQSTAMHTGPERQASILGSRTPIVAALRRVGKADPDVVLREIEKRSMTVNGGMIGAAEVLEQLGGERVVPVLEKMLLNALLMDESRRSNYEKETYWDAADQTRKELTPDLIAAPLVHALGTVGGSHAEKVLRDILERIRSGRVASPGEETLATLAKFVGVSSRHLANVEKEEDSHLRDSKILGLPGHAHTIVELDPDEVRQLIKALNSSYLFSGSAKRTQAKVTALNRLAQLTPVEALDAVLKCLSDKDPIVRSAAIAAAAEFGSADQPTYQIEQVLDETLKRLEHKDGEVRLTALSVLKELGPKRPEVRQRIVEFAKLTDSAELRARLKEVLEGGGKRGSSEVEYIPHGRQEERPPEEEIPSANVPVSKLDLKHQYFEARRAWIEGGKRGDPPKPPPGL